MLCFAIGLIGVLTRRNPIVLFMCIELMLNSVNLLFVAFGTFLNSLDGQVIVFITMTVAAAEVAVGLALIVSIFRARQEIDLDFLNLLKW